MYIHIVYVYTHTHTSDIGYFIYLCKTINTDIGSHATICIYYIWTVARRPFQLNFLVCLSRCQNCAWNTVCSVLENYYLIRYSVPTGKRNWTRATRCGLKVTRIHSLHSSERSSQPNLLNSDIKLLNKTWDTHLLV